MPVPSAESLDLLGRALDQAAEAIASVSEEQLAEITPCEDWDVSLLISHLMQDVRSFTIAVEGGDPDWSAQPAPVQGDFAGDFRRLADALMATWRAAGDVDTSPGFQVPEIAVHTWDLVRATGQDLDLDRDVASYGLSFMTEGLTPDNRGAMFAPEVEVADDAPAPDRLAAFAGRDPS